MRKSQLSVWHQEQYYTILSFHNLYVLKIRTVLRSVSINYWRVTVTTVDESNFSKVIHEVITLYNTMVAHVVKTQKPVQIRATFLLFDYSLCSMDFAHAW